MPFSVGGLEGKVFGEGGGTHPTSNIYQDNPYLPTKFPFTLHSYIRGQVVFPIDYFPSILLNNGPVLI
jgi:hypothetical protein